MKFKSVNYAEMTPEQRMAVERFKEIQTKIDSVLVGKEIEDVLTVLISKITQCAVMRYGCAGAIQYMCEAMVPTICAAIFSHIYCNLDEHDDAIPPKKEMN